MVRRSQQFNEIDGVAIESRQLEKTNVWEDELFSDSFQETIHVWPRTISIIIIKPFVNRFDWTFGLTSIMWLVPVQSDSSWHGNSWRRNRISGPFSFWSSSPFFSLVCLSFFRAIASVSDFIKLANEEDGVFSVIYWRRRNKLEGQGVRRKVLFVYMNTEFDWCWITTNLLLSFFQLIDFVDENNLVRDVRV